MNVFYQPLRCSIRTRVVEHYSPEFEEETRRDCPSFVLHGSTAQFSFFIMSLHRIYLPLLIAIQPGPVLISMDPIPFSTFPTLFPSHGFFLFTLLGFDSCPASKVSGTSFTPGIGWPLVIRSTIWLNGVGYGAGGCPVCSVVLEGETCLLVSAEIAERSLGIGFSAAVDG